MSVHTLLVVIFIMMVCFYLVTNNVNPPDLWIIFVSLLVLLFTVLKPTPSKGIEGFVNSSLAIKSEVITLADILSTHQKMDLEENITDISAALALYTTSFNTKSYPNYGKTWVNIAPSPSVPTKDCPIDSRSLTFELNPIFSRKTGFYLGNNRLVGPLSNSLGVQFHNTFTMVFVVKHSNLMVSTGNQEIEFLKLYANSPNNNGMSMYIKKDSLAVENNVQVGSLMFQYADKPPQQCLMNADDSLMHLDKDLLVFFYIVKDIDNIRILYMTEKSNIIHQLLKFNVSNEDITFSNKEMVINRMVSWNANLYNFALYNKALTDDEVTSFYNHIIGEYMKNVDPSYTKILEKYNTAVDFLTDFTKCPYDQTTCGSCTSVTSWCDSSQVLATGTTCRSAIDKFCTANPKNPACKCWDSSSAVFNTEQCKLYRSIFGSRENFLNFLSLDDIEFIKKKYKLMTLEECPKELKEKPSLATTRYDNYDYSKLKVKMEPEAQKRLYPSDKKCETLLAPARAPSELDNIIVKMPNTMSDSHKGHTDHTEYLKKLDDAFDLPLKPTDRLIIEKPINNELESVLLKKPEPVESSTLNDLYLKDPNMNFEPDKTIAGQQYKQIEDLARREQNSHLRIGQVQRPNTSRAAQELPAIQQKSFGVGADKPDSFFSKFIKIMVPS